MVYKKPQEPPAKRKKSNRKTKQILILVAMLLVIILIICLVISLFRKPKEPVTPQGDPTPPSIIDYGGHEIPVISDLPPNPYDSDLYVVNNGIMTYQSDDVQTFMGIDVSSHQDDIDWMAVKQAGVDYAMIRAGYRGATEGRIYADNKFTYNINSAEAAGIDVGIYFFSQATTVEEAQQEADILIQWIKGYDIAYPVVFDWEFMHHIEGNRTGNMSGDTITDCALAFCSIIAQNGYTPMIYFNLDLAYNYYDLSRIGHIDFWLAEWHHVPPTFYYEFQMLQYTSQGTIPGITGELDLNICFVDYAGKRQ